MLAWHTITRKSHLQTKLFHGASFNELYYRLSQGTYQRAPISSCLRPGNAALMLRRFCLEIASASSCNPQDLLSDFPHVVSSLDRRSSSICSYHYYPWGHQPCLLLVGLSSCRRCTFFRNRRLPGSPCRSFRFHNVKVDHPDGSHHTGFLFGMSPCLPFSRRTDRRFLALSVRPVLEP